MALQITTEQVARVMALVEDGRSQRYAARAVELPETTVRRAIRRYRETGHCERRRGSGRPKSTSRADDRFILLEALRDRRQTAVSTNRRLREIRATFVSDKTVCRRLQSAGLKSRRPATGPRLLQQHRVARLNFARLHQAWNEEDWARVLFSDESRFCLYSPDGRERLWRRDGERYQQGMFSERESFGGGSVMIWAGISFNAKTELCVLPRNALTAEAYINVLEEHVVPFAPFVGNDFLFMQDNARPHTARIVTQYLDEVGIERLQWPARSPDINPIEHVWDELGRRIRSRRVAPVNLYQLGEALVDEWEDFPQQTVANLIASMPRRMEAVIQARGGNTRY